MAKYIVPKGTSVRLYKIDNSSSRLNLIDKAFITERTCFFDDDDFCTSHIWVTYVFAFVLPKNNRKTNLMVVDKTQVEIYD